MSFELPPLPYSKDALEPHISGKLMGFHYEKHHKGYVDKLNNAVKGTPMADKSLEEVVKSSEGGVFNNAAQTWNHTFFWKSMKPGGGGKPTGAIAQKIDDRWGSHADFKKEFSDKAATLFGSGWCWLVDKGGKLEIVQKSNAGNPMTDGDKPVLTLDVWEHAYYLDYQNRRAEFIEKFLDNLVNWDHANQNLG